MPSLSAARTANAALKYSYRPTAVFFGGTSGIGEGTLQAFAHAVQGRARIVLVSRNQASADRIFATLPKHAESAYEVVECADLSLIKDVVKACAEIRKRVETVNVLMLTQGIFSLGGFDPTSEGIDKRIALNYYGRFKVVDELLPTLEKAVAEGEEARVLTVLAAGQGAALEMDNVGLKNNFSGTKTFSQVPTWIECMVENYAKSHPKISFIHMSPGMVKSNLLTKGGIGYRILGLGLGLFAISARDCGEYMTYALTNEQYKSGAWHLSDKAEPVPANKVFVTPEATEKVLEDYKSTVAVA